MAGWDDVERIALSLPETAADGLSWKVRKKGFAWERPLRKADLAALGLTEQRSPVLGIRVADEGVKHALVASRPGVYFTTPHFDGYPAVLVWLERIPVDELREVLVEAWLTQAPKRVAAAYVSEAEAHGEFTG